MVNNEAIAETNTAKVKGRHDITLRQALVREMLAQQNGKSGGKVTNSQTPQEQTQTQNLQLVKRDWLSSSLLQTSWLK